LHWDGGGAHRDSNDTRPVPSLRGLVVLTLSTGYAEDQQQRPAEQAAPSDHEMMGQQGLPGQMQHTMGNPDTMANMQRMMDNPEMATQMRQMMENCNKMMESLMQQSPAAPAPQEGG
jgi:hypothetical protein